MFTSLSLKIILMLITWNIKDTLGIQNVKLVLPTIVQAGTSATLLCLYDLEGAPLYSVQWYRGQFEFFRYVPNENPPTKVFQIPGLDVDAFASNEHQVTLRNIPVQISGIFSCEVTTDAPPFSASCVSGNLTVVNINLDLKVPKKYFHFGEYVEANCTLKPNMSSTKLIFHWNTKLISEKFVSRYASNNAILHLNTAIFDTGQPFPTIIQLRCSALFDDVYYIISKSISLTFKSSSFGRASSATKSGTNYFLIVICVREILRMVAGLFQFSCMQMFNSLYVTLSLF